MNVPICRLCKANKNLVKKSHILPKSFYERIFEKLKDEYPEKLDKELTPRIKFKENYYQIFQSGLHGADRLCEKCESKISKWDKYAVENLFTKNIDNEIEQKIQLFNPLFIEINEIDYKQLKLFFMSLLWRSQIFNDYSFPIKKGEKLQFFQDIEIGEENESRLREMIYNEEPGEEDDFSFLLIKYLDKESLLTYFSSPILIPASGKKYIPQFGNYGITALRNLYLFPFGDYGITAPRNLYLFPFGDYGITAPRNVYLFRFGDYGLFIKVDTRPSIETDREFILKPNQPLKLIIR